MTSRKYARHQRRKSRKAFAHGGGTGNYTSKYHHRLFCDLERIKSKTLTEQVNELLGPNDDSKVREMLKKAFQD